MGQGSVPLVECQLYHRDVKLLQRRSPYLLRLERVDNLGA